MPELQAEFSAPPVETGTRLLRWVRGEQVTDRERNVGALAELIASVHVQEPLALVVIEGYALIVGKVIVGRVHGIPISRCDPHPVVADVGRYRETALPMGACW